MKFKTFKILTLIGFILGINSGSGLKGTVSPVIYFEKTESMPSILLIGEKFPNDGKNNPEHFKILKNYLEQRATLPQKTLVLIESNEYAYKTHPNESELWYEFSRYAYNFNKDADFYNNKNVSISLADVRGKHIINLADFFSTFKQEDQIQLLAQSAGLKNPKQASTLKELEDFLAAHNKRNFFKGSTLQQFLKKISQESKNFSTHDFLTEVNNNLTALITFRDSLPVQSLPYAVIDQFCKGIHENIDLAQKFFSAYLKTFEKPSTEAFINALKKEQSFKSILTAYNSWFDKLYSIIGIANFFRAMLNNSKNFTQIILFCEYQGIEPIKNALLFCKLKERKNISTMADITQLERFLKSIPTIFKPSGSPSSSKTSLPSSTTTATTTHTQPPSAAPIQAAQAQLTQNIAPQFLAVEQARKMTKEWEKDNDEGWEEESSAAGEKIIETPKQLNPQTPETAQKAPTAPKAPDQTTKKSNNKSKEPISSTSPTWKRWMSWIATGSVAVAAIACWNYKDQIKQVWNNLLSNNWVNLWTFGH